MAVLQRQCAGKMRRLSLAAVLGQIGRLMILAARRISSFLALGVAGVLLAGCAPPAFPRTRITIINDTETGVHVRSAQYQRGDEQSILPTERLQLSTRDSWFFGAIYNRNGTGWIALAV